MVRMRGRCHQWRCLPPLLQPWPPEWLGGHSARSRGSAPAATRPPGFLTFATPTGKQEADSVCTMRMWGDLCNTAVWGWNCVASGQYAHHLCYFAISISQLCKQEKLNISQSNSKPWWVNVSRLHRHWYKISDCICVVPSFYSWDQLFAGASEGSPLWPQTCGAKM